jgi:hypothetical protein
MSMARLGFSRVEGKIGVGPLQETEEVSAMQKVLAVMVLGVSLEFTSSTAFAGDRGVVEPVAQATQAVMPGYDTGYSTVVQPSQPTLVVQFPL